MKRSKSEIHRIMEDIRKYRDKDYSDTQIRINLGIPERTFRRYSSKIRQEDKKIWLSMTQDRLEYELLRLKSSLEDTYQIAKSISENERIDPDDRLNALNTMNDARLSIVQLLRDGPQYIEIDEQKEQKLNIEYTALKKQIGL